MYQRKAKRSIVLQEEEQEGEEEADDEEGSMGPDYDYLLGMKMWALTLERKNEILKNRDDKRQELRVLKEKTPELMWTTDLDNFLELVSQMTIAIVKDHSTPFEYISDFVQYATNGKEFISNVGL